MTCSRLAVPVAALVLSAFAGTAAGGSAAPAPEQCRGDFEATVRVGPDHGLSLRGVLRVRVAPSGAITASITRKSGAPVRVSGQATGRAISFTIALGTNRVLYGSGAGTFPIAMCKGELGGVFAGPRPGDVGE